MSRMRSSKQVSGALRALALVVMLAFVAGSADAQVFELRHVFENYRDWRVMGGGTVFGPVSSQLDPSTADHNIPFDSSFDGKIKVSLEYWQLRAGVSISPYGTFAPYLFWNPVIAENGFGSDSSRWSASIGWEGIFSNDRDFSPLKLLQPDNSVFTPKNSFSMILGYWFGDQLDSAEWHAILRRAYPELRPNDLERWVTMQTVIDTNYAGRGLVDTNNYRSAPLDTNSYVRGLTMLPGIPQQQNNVRFISRQGLSAAVGLGTGQYAGSGPISKFLNFFYSESKRTQNDTSKLYELGMNPMLLLRYRYDDFIAHLEVAGEDVNAGVILRHLRSLDIEVGVKYLEHLFYRTSRGANRMGPFISLRYAPAFNLDHELIENGEEIYSPSADSDGDGIPDGLEENITRTDPYNPDSDGDGLSDGLEVHTYRTNPLGSDSDGDGLSDGQEILTPGRRSDPLRGDTDEDGISDGEEVLRGTDPLIPAGGERGR